MINVIKIRVLIIHVMEVLIGGCCNWNPITNEEIETIKKYIKGKQYQVYTYGT